MPIEEGKTLSSFWETALVEGVYSRLKNVILNDIPEPKAPIFEEETNKLNRWDEDRRKLLKYMIKPYDDHIAGEKKSRKEFAPSTGKKAPLVIVWSGCPEDVKRQKNEPIGEVEAHLRLDME